VLLRFCGVLGLVGGALPVGVELIWINAIADNAIIAITAPIISSCPFNQAPLCSAKKIMY